jgi:hypothetical protein
MSSKARYFNRQGDEIDESIALDRGIMRDGMTARVPLQFRDSLRRPSNLRITAGDGTLDGLHRPGFRVRGAATRDAYHRERTAYIDRVTNAWRDQPDNELTGVGSGEFGAQPREGDVCFLNGSPGHINAEGKCVVDQPDWPSQRSKQDAQHDHRSRMAKIYSDLDLESSNAWRGGKS